VLEARQIASPAVLSALIGLASWFARRRRRRGRRHPRRARPASGTRRAEDASGPR